MSHVPLVDMDKAIQSYCSFIGDTSDELCGGCKIAHLCEPIMGCFEDFPDITKQAYEIVSADNLAVSCESCEYDKCGCDEYPCTECKHNKTSSSPEYESTPLLFTPKKCKQLDTSGTVVNHPVTHPSHYTQGGIECIDAMQSAFGKEAVANFCKCNAFKYIWRAEHKNGLQDIDKSIWYLNKYKELVANE